MNDEQEPVARVAGTYGGRFVIEALNPALVLPVGMALYAKREWVGLTDEEIKEIWGSYFSRGVEFARAIEAKLKEKNT